MTPCHRVTDLRIAAAKRPSALPTRRRGRCLRGSTAATSISRTSPAARVPALTAPFVFTTWFFLFAFFSFHVLSPTEFIAPGVFPEHIADKGVVGAGTFFDGFFKGIGEVFFQDNVGTGAFFLAGILVNSRISVLFAALASLLGVVVGMGVGAGEGTLRLGSTASTLC